MSDLFRRVKYRPGGTAPPYWFHEEAFDPNFELTDEGLDAWNREFTERGLSLTVARCLMRARCWSPEDVARTNDEDLCRVRNLGRTGFEQVRRAIPYAGD